MKEIKTEEALGFAMEQIPKGAFLTVRAEKKRT